MCHQIEDETTVTDGFSVRVPSAVREVVDIEPGDQIRWRVDASGDLSVDVLTTRYGAFSELDPVDVGEATDVATEHTAGALDSVSGSEESGTPSE